MPVRTPTELATMREAGRVVATTLAAVRTAAQPGVRLRELDELAQTCLREAGALPSFLGYAPSWAPTPFNGVLCLSPNEVVVHGRPNGRRLDEGDLLTVDFGAVVDGWHGDSAITLHVGAPSGDDPRLLAATEQALHAGIAAAVPGATLLDVARAVDDVARAHGFAQLPDHGGHGIGRSMHEPPFVPNAPTRDAGRVVLAGRQHPRHRADAARRRQRLPHEEGRLVDRHRRPEPGRARRAHRRRDRRRTGGADRGLIQGAGRRAGRAVPDGGPP